MALSKILPASQSQFAGARNLVINGAAICSQRGASFTSSGVFPVDRFKMDKNGANITSTQNALTSGEPYDEGFRFSAKMATTSTDSNSANYYLLRHRIEAQNLASCGWNYTSSSSYITLSSWIKSSIAGTYYILIRTKDGTGQSYVHEYTLAANTWKKISFSMQGNSNITFNMDNGEGLEITFSPYLGTDFTSSSTTLNAWGAWNGSTGYGKDYAHDFGATSGSTFEITGVQLEVGDATPFEHEDYTTTLTKCRRYFLRYYGNESPNFPRWFNPAYANDCYMGGNFSFPVQMRATPSVSASVTYQNSDGLGTGDVSREGVNLYVLSTGAATISGAYITNNSSDHVTVDAEL